MIKGLLRGFALLAALVAATGGQAAEVAGVRLPDSIDVAGQRLVLNGAGLRTRMFFKVYVAALYLPARSASAADVVGANAPRRVNLHLLREVGADSLVKALREGVAQNHAAAEVAALAPRLDQLEASMRGIGAGRAGDVISLDFSVTGVEVAYNGQPRGGVPDAALARALLRVWLGEQPVDPALKKALLGG